MKSRKGFTLIELMIVVVIVAVLAAVVVPLLLSRVERAKYSEGKAVAGQIATAVRTYAVEADTVSATPVLTTDLGFKSNELDSKYFDQDGMSIAGVAVSASGQVSYVITLTPRASMGLSSGNLVLTCTAANSYSPTFTPTGI
jgi:type IV pilus assembly protein PilA